VNSFNLFSIVRCKLGYNLQLVEGDQYLIEVDVAHLSGTLQVQGTKAK